MNENRIREIIREELEIFEKNFANKNQEKFTKNTENFDEKIFSQKTKIATESVILTILKWIVIVYAAFFLLAMAFGILVQIFAKF